MIDVRLDMLIDPSAHASAAPTRLLYVNQSGVKHYELPTGSQMIDGLAMGETRGDPPSGWFALLITPGAIIVLWRSSSAPLC